MKKTPYDPSQFADSVGNAIREESRKAMREGGYSAPEAALIVSQFAIASGLGFTAAAMGKSPPTMDEVKEITEKIIVLISDSPNSSGASNN